MNWLPMLLQTVLKFYSQVQITQATATKAKEIAIQSSIVALGSLIALVFLLASTVMVFVDLGNQFESHGDLHFSGMMLSAVFLSVLGFIAFGICFFLAKYFSAKEKLKAAEEKKEQKDFVSQYGPILVFVEELIKQFTDKASSHHRTNVDAGEEPTS